MPTSASPIRIGILGAASVVPSALLRPSREVTGVATTTVAARDPHRAYRFALKHNIPRVRDSYEQLLSDPEIDAVYVALPAALHARWTMAAMQAGKHVLCEKPFTSNVDAARTVATAAGEADVVVMEAYHSAHHPLQQRLRNILASGQLGRVVCARAVFCIPLVSKKAIQWNAALGGGGLLDVGYYPLRLLRDLFGEPNGILDAQAWTCDNVDRRFEATMQLPRGVRGEVISAIWSRRLLASYLEVTGHDGSLRVSWPCHPQSGAKLLLRRGDQRRLERADRRPSYSFQLEAFRDAIRKGAPPITGASEAVKQLQVIDDLYLAAGMPPRRSDAS